jgi:2'-5' RNA ligase
MVEENKEKQENQKMIRCFICLELSREAIDYLDELQGIIKKKNILQGNYTEPENLHLTLKFLGEIEETKIEEVKKKLAEIKIKRFSVKLGSFGLFSKKSFRILWIKLLSEGIYELQKEIDNKLEGLFEKEEKFMAHTTIVRIKKVFDRNIFLDYVKNIKTKKIDFQVCDFVLKKSELKEDGPNYSNIERYNLE